MLASEAKSRYQIALANKPQTWVEKAKERIENEVAEGRCMVMMPVEVSKFVITHLEALGYVCNVKIKFSNGCCGVSISWI